LAKAIIRSDGKQLPETGTGLAGMVRGDDLTTQPAAATTPDSVIVPLTNVRKLIAKAMHASLQNSAQLTHHLGADARRILSLRKKIKKAVANGYPSDITLNDMICRAVILALQKFPSANAHFLGDSTRNFSGIHLGFAVDTERGLMVPSIPYADGLSIQELSARMKEIAEDCKKGSVNPDLLAPEAASFTVSNLGNYGVEMFTPIINLPQVAILGVNTIVPRPKELEEGVYGFVPYLGLSLTYDHRAIDGGYATRFLKQIAIEIENLEIETINNEH
jgi:pyruvate dehydrogenase E2 component (dihydrolipoamide acetyltransferase)